MKHLDFINELFGGPSKYLKGLGGNHICRNSHQVYDTPSGLILVKEFRHQKAFEIEKKGYEFFTKSGLILVPKLHYAEDSLLITDFIHPTKKYDLKKTIEDWARVHSSTKKIGEDGKIKSVIHRDLYSNNIINSDEGQFYIDFECFGTGHPTKDLSLLLFNEKALEKEIINLYRSKIDFDYEEIERDIFLNYKMKLNELIKSLSQDRNVPEGFKKKFMNKAINALRDINK